MALKGVALKKALNAVRSQQFKKSIKRGQPKRHPEREVTVYNKEDVSCTRLRSDYSVRPERLDKHVTFTTVTVAPSDPQQPRQTMTKEQAAAAFELKVSKLGLTLEQWEAYKPIRDAKRKNGEPYTLEDFKLTL